MEGNKMERKAKCSRDEMQPGEYAWSETSKNYLQTLMHREIGIGTSKPASTKDFEPLVEESLVKKELTERKYNLPGVPRATYLMVYSPDGTKIASTHGNHSIYVTDIATGKNIKTLLGHPRTPWCIAFHPMFNNILASGCLAGQVRIWDLNGGCEIWDGVCETVIASLAFHPTKRLLVFATHNSLHFWEWSKPKLSATKTAIAPRRIRYVAFDKSGTKLLTGIENVPKRTMRTRNAIMALLPMVSLNSVHRFRNTHYGVRESSTDRVQYDNSGRRTAAQRRNSNNNDNISAIGENRESNGSADSNAWGRRYGDYINRLLRFRNSPGPQTGVVNIEVRRNTYGGPYEDEASGDGRSNDTNLPHPPIDATNTRNRRELQQLQSTSDTESSRVELPTPSTSTSTGSSHSNQRGSNFNNQRPDVLAAIWPRRRNEPPHPAPPVPVRPFIPPSPSSPIPSPLCPLSRSADLNFGASTSSSTSVASTSNVAPTSESVADDAGNRESQVDDSRQNISDYGKAYNELIDSCQEAARLIGERFKGIPKNDEEREKFRTETFATSGARVPDRDAQKGNDWENIAAEQSGTIERDSEAPSEPDSLDNDNVREAEMSETTSASNRSKPIRRRLEQNNGHGIARDESEPPVKKKIHDNSSDDALAYRVADAGESSSLTARTSSEEETEEQVSRRMTPASTNLPSTSSFTVSSRSAFQPQQPRIRDHSLDSETSFSNYLRKETREILARDNAGIFRRQSRVECPGERHEKTRIGKIHYRGIPRHSDTSTRNRESLGTLSTTPGLSRINDENHQQLGGENPSNHSNSPTSNKLNNTARIDETHEENEETHASRSHQGPDNQSSGPQTPENCADECKNNNNNAESNEQSGYWLLEENSDSDWNNANVNASASTSTNSGNSKSRWIPLQCAQTSADSAGTSHETSMRRYQRDEEAPRRITDDRDSLIDRDRLSPVLINSMDHDPSPLFPFSSLQARRAIKREEDKRKEATAKAASSSSTFSSESSRVIEHDDSRRSGSLFNAPSTTSDFSSSSSSTTSCTVNNQSQYDLNLSNISDSIAPRKCIKLLRYILHAFLISGKMILRDRPRTDETDFSDTFGQPTGRSSAHDIIYDYGTPIKRFNTMRLEIKCLANASVMWMHLANHVFSLYRIISFRRMNECSPGNAAVFLEAMKLVTRETASLFEELKRATAEGTLPTNVLRVSSMMYWGQITSELVYSWADGLPLIMDANNESTTNSSSLASSASNESSSNSPSTRVSNSNNPQNDSSNSQEINVSPANNDQPSTSRDKRNAANSLELPPKSSDDNEIILRNNENDNNVSDSELSGDATSANHESSPIIENSDVVSMAKLKIEENNEKVEARSNYRDDNVEGMTTNSDYTHDPNDSEMDLEPVSPVFNRKSTDAVDSASGDDTLSKKYPPARDNANSFVSKNNSTANATNALRPDEEIASCSQTVTANHPDNVKSGDRLEQYDNELDECCKWLSEMITSLENLAKKIKRAGGFQNAKLRRPAESRPTHNYVTAISQLDARFQLFLVIERLPIILRTMKRCHSDPFDRSGVQRNIFHKIIMILKSANAITYDLLKYWDGELSMVKQEFRALNDEERRNSATRNRERASSEGVQADNPFDPIAVALRFDNASGQRNHSNEFHSYYLANRIRPASHLRREPRSFPSERSGRTSIFNNLRSHVHERRGFNVPVVQVNNVPINFANSSTESQHLRLRSFDALRNYEFRRLLQMRHDLRMRRYDRDVSGDPAQSMIQRDRFSWLDATMSLAHRPIHALGTIGNLEIPGSGGVQQDSGNESYDAELLDRLNISAFNNCDDLKTYRIQAWDFTNDEIPCIEDTDQNIVVWHCKIYNDASIDISSDGKLLAWMGNDGNVAMIGVQSLERETLGNFLYAAFPNYGTHVSVSLSPTSRYLLLGWHSQMHRMAGNAEPALSRSKLATIFELKSRSPKRDSEVKKPILKTSADGIGTSPMRPRREVNEVTAEPEEREKENDRDENNEDDDDDNAGRTDGACRNRQKSRLSNVSKSMHVCLMSEVREVVASKSDTDSDGINCIKWAPKSGQGIVYGTNTGHLNILY